MDSMDTMLIMDLMPFYQRGYQYLQKKLDWDQDISVSVFETTIRCLGGLLSAYDMTFDPFLLKAAKELGDKLLPAFSTPTGIPYTSVNLRSGFGSNPSWNQHSTVLADLGTLQIEFTKLSNITGDMIYAEKAMHVYEYLKQRQPDSKLYPVWIDSQTGIWTNDLVSVGAYGDSFYEYLLKLWLLSDDFENVGDWYIETAEAIIQKLVVKVEPDMYFIGEKGFGTTVHPDMDHLACFAGGMFALGSKFIKDPEIAKKHLEVGKGIGKFCHEMYSINPTGLACEKVSYANGRIIIPPRGSSSRAFQLRPESVETWFILYRITKDPMYRDWGWDFLVSLNTYCKKEYGYTGLRDSASVASLPDDRQHSWFLAETLKYLYLLFSPDDTIPIDEFFFNTEAHPIRKYNLPHLNQKYKEF
eukprot:TRINITY_DN1319_c0_g1_i2.p1 TRINITY_DN1319_c0_g1~~TRINITY_DN1319_c0_g1_i2.p1  ORF type:complete len:414 (-),score=79.17 TRINITY_DN1319_c0_g1_i2:66-1307(-)